MQIVSCEVRRKGRCGMVINSSGMNKVPGAGSNVKQCLGRAHSGSFLYVNENKSEKVWSLCHTLKQFGNKRHLSVRRCQTWVNRLQNTV